MPFQSEKQRRYLWANEPEIARDWTDTYGSGIAKALGGRIPFAEGSKKTSIPEWNLAILKTALETATSDEERAEIQSQIDTVEGDIGTGADTLLGSGEAPTEGFWGKLSKMLGMSQAEGAEIGNTAEDVMRQEFFDYGTQEADMGEYANLKVPGLNVQHPEGIASINPHGWEYGNQWQKREQQKGGNWLRNIADLLPFFGKNTRTGAFMRMLRNQFMPDGGITSMFNRPTTPQQQATQRFMQNYNVGRNPQTGRMVGGPFAGMNAPGTSMFGSKTPKEMAQNWMKKYGDMQYQTRKQQLKQQQIKNIATMNYGPAGITPQAPTRPVHSGQPTGGHHEGGGGGIGSTASKQGGAPGTKDASPDWRAKGGRIGRLQGGLAALWPR